MRILVTGGAGFIGSALIRYLLGETHAQVVNVDLLTYAGNRDSLSSVDEGPRYAFEHVDIRDGAALDAVFERHRPNAVMHLAAESHVDRSIDGPAAFMETNLFGTYELLQATRRFRDRLPEHDAAQFRFLHVSTDEVYGDLEGTEDLFRETTRYAPSSPYAATKAGSDHLVRAWGRTYGLPVLVTNCSNNYGPYQFPEKLIPHMILSALSGKPLPVYGDGRQVRDWLYVEDHARALWLVVTRGRVGETYNIGGHNEQRNIDVVRSICTTLEVIARRPAGVDRFDGLDPIRSRIGPVTTSLRDRRRQDRARARLGPAESFTTGLEKTIRWYLENRWWWQRVLDGSYRLERIGTARAK